MLEISIEHIDKSVSSGSPEQADQYVSVAIKDSGVGISKEISKKIFDPFFTTKTKGNGLGLATCYSIMQKHHGSIDVSSAPGKGSCFTICLPAAAADAVESDRRKEDDFLGSGTMLILDDEEYIRDILEKMLKSFGYSVISTEDGDAAIRIAEELESSGKQLTAAILDLTIPGGLGGDKIHHQIRSLFPACILLASSGYSDTPIMSRPTDFGFDHSLPKPYRRKDLASILSKWFGSIDDQERPIM